MFPSKHLSKQYSLLFKTWPCPLWDGLRLFGLWPSWALGLGLIFMLCLLLIFEKTRRKNFRCEGK